MLPPVAIQMGGTVKLLPTQQALLHLHFHMQYCVAIQMVRAVEPLAADLAQELLVLRVRVYEDVPLELVLVVKLLSADLASDGNVLAVSSPST